MTQLKVAEADVVISLVDLSADREILDHVTHDLKAFAVVARVVEADAGLESCLGANLFIPVGLVGDRFKVCASSVVGAVTIKEVISQHHMGSETHSAARISFDHRPPDFQRLGDFFGVVTGLAGLNQLASSAIFDDRAAQWRVC